MHMMDKVKMHTPYSPDKSQYMLQMEKKISYMYSYKETFTCILLDVIGKDTCVPNTRLQIIKFNLRYNKKETLVENAALNVFSA